MTQPIEASVRRHAANQDTTKQEGFSVVEGLMAAAIILIVAVGVLPLFVNAMTDNLQGRRSTEVANAARSHAERLMQLDFNHVELTIPNGNTELETTDYQVSTFDALEQITTKQWLNETAHTETGTEDLVRITTIRQYNFAALDDELVDASEALAGGSPPGDIDFKEIEIQLASPEELNKPGKRLTVRFFRGA